MTVRFSIPYMHMTDQFSILQKSDRIGNCLIAVSEHCCIDHSIKSRRSDLLDHFCHFPGIRQTGISLGRGFQCDRKAIAFRDSGKISHRFHTSLPDRFIFFIQASETGKELTQITVHFHRKLHGFYIYFQASFSGLGIL